MSITVEARYKEQQLVLETPLNLPEGQRVRVTIEPVDEPSWGQRTIAQWEQAGVIGAWAHRKPKTSSAVWARQLRTKASRRQR